MEIENPIVVNLNWREYSENEREKKDKAFRRKADEEYDEEAAYVAEHGWGRTNGYTL